ncbi:hypothetical protein [Halococcus saccharolyticus]|uniref:DUF8055 domain-containing protein n=1 Tax=Halococcus saccharolyticus DSM 5350 TaxID=1227455 RepID=M0MSB8_9EURY|nr:hypothetical protein [Halococcus saccharolyticus]EMA47365.1 hypothetical protein C449_01416 [Halococcus saccharolyticus DSM 5350]
MTSGYADRIAGFAEQAERDRREFDPPSDPPDEARAMAFLREGLGPLVALYLEARTAEWDVEFSAAELEQIHRATNAWLALYARCYGVEMEPDVTVRRAAELLLDTNNIRDTAQLLTRVPART